METSGRLITILQHLPDGLLAVCNQLSRQSIVVSIVSSIIPHTTPNMTPTNYSNIHFLFHDPYTTPISVPNVFIRRLRYGIDAAPWPSWHLRCRGYMGHVGYIGNIGVITAYKGYIGVNLRVDGGIEKNMESSRA